MRINKLVPAKVGFASKFCGIFFAAICICGVTHAQISVTASIDLTKPGNFLAPRALGVQAAMADTDMLKPETVSMLREAGILTLRYPGGRAADYNHWNTFNKYDSRHPVDFGSFVKLIDQLGGTMMLAVNYGSDAANEGPGEPAEAAAWVAYVNGMPTDTHLIGADSAGRDWKTTGFWATMRSSAPIEHDDGYNFLRLSHPKQLNIKYWEIGNEIYANGYYAKDAGGAEIDRHAPSDPDKGKNTALRAKNPKLGPAAYGAGVSEFAKAMKAVDSRISIGVATVMPTPTDDWNRTVLKSCAADVDFVILHWYSQPLLGPDYKDLDAAAFLSEPTDDLPKYIDELVTVMKTAAPGKAIQLAVTEMGVPAWVHVPKPVVMGLFAADAYASLALDGAVNIDWAELHSPYLLSSKDNSPQPAFFGIEMVHRAVNTRDVFVAAKSSTTMVTVHAAKRADGSVGIMLVNKSPDTAANVKVKIAGDPLAAAGTRYDWGATNPATGAKVQQSQATSLGNSFTVNVPAYTVTDLVIPIAK